MRNRDRVAVDIGDVGQDVSGRRGTRRLIDGEQRDGRGSIAVGVRLVVHRGDGEGERARRVERAIRDDVGDDRDVAVPIGSRGEGVSASGLGHRDGTDRGAAQRDRGGLGSAGERVVGDATDGEAADAQRRTRIDVGIVRDEVAGRGRVLIGRQGIRHGDRGVVDGRDGQDEVTRIRTALTIGNGVGHGRDGPVPIGDRHEDIGAVGIERERSLVGQSGRLAGQLGLSIHGEAGDAQRVVLDIGVVGQDIAGRVGVFGARTGVVDRERRIVGVRDREAELRVAGQLGGAGFDDVGNRVGDRRERAEIILLAGRGGERVVAVGADAEDTLGRA